MVLSNGNLSIVNSALQVRLARISSKKLNWFLIVACGIM
jgi:hypothetical protein